MGCDNHMRCDLRWVVIIRRDVMIMDEMMRHTDLTLSRITKDKMWLSEMSGDKQNWDVMRDEMWWGKT